MPYIVANDAGEMISSTNPLELTKQRGLAIRFSRSKAEEYALLARCQLEGRGQGKRRGFQLRRADRVR